MDFDQLAARAAAFLDRLSQTPLPAVCEACRRSRTDRATACCRVPICSDCVGERKRDRRTGERYRTEWVHGRRLTGSYLFTCPYCRADKAVTDRDRGGTSWAMHLAAGGDDPPLVVMIANPEEDGGWR